MKLTFKKLLFATIVIILLDIASLWIHAWVCERYGLTNWIGWIDLKTLKFWAKDIALLIAWGMYFLGKEKK